MRDKEKVSIAYDQEADVLYLSYQDVPAEAEEVGSGVFARYHPRDKHLVGFTIVNFSAKFSESATALEIPYTEA